MDETRSGGWRGGSDDARVQVKARELASYTDIEITGYRIHGLLGVGGFGTVLDASRCEDGLPVAVKIARHDQPLACERLAVESAALRAIGPPFVPALYAEGRLANGSPYLVVERLTVPSLTRLLGKPMAPGEFFPLAMAVLHALGAAHARGFLHCDIKPDNIFVSTSPPSAKLIDFGLARLFASEGAALGETTEGIVLGTPLYMSPEQCEGRSDIDVRADIYAMGVVFYEMLTGRAPFAGEPAEVRIAHVSRRPLPPSHLAPVPRALDEIILRCLAKLPDQRYASVAALEHALGRARTDARAEPAMISAPTGQCTPGQSGQQVMVGLVFFEAEVDTATVQHVLAGKAGRLVSIAGKRCIAAFGLDTSDDPVERALDGAQVLLQRGVTSRITLDCDRVRLHRSPDGSERLLSPALHRKQRFPVPTDPSGILLTSASAGAMSGLETAAVPGRDELVVLVARHADPGESHLASLLGRDQIIGELVASARHAAALSEPIIATVLAETGFGKSHLASAVLAELGRGSLPAHFIRLRAREPLGGDKDLALRQLLLAALRLPDVEAPGSTDEARRLICQALGPELGSDVWPAVALVLGWLPPDAPDVQKLSAAPAALRAAVAQAAGQALRGLASQTLVCCILDDAHFADETTLDALEYATLEEARVPLWVCVLARPGFEHARPHWARRAARSQIIPLAGLPAEAAARLCRHLLSPAENVPEPIIARLVAQTQGNPLLLTELARAIKHHGLIRQHARGQTWYLAVDELERLVATPRVEWLVERELGSLPEELLAHARLIALLAAEVTVAEVDGVLRELDREGLGSAFLLDAWVATSRLIERGLLVRLDDEGIGFRHELLREHVVRTMPEALRRGLHRAAFHFYRHASNLAERRRLPLMAHHAGRSGEPEAASMYMELAERARQRHDYLEAEVMYSRAIELMDERDDTMRMRAHNGRGLMHYRLSRFGDALSDLRRARAIARNLGDVPAQAELLLDEATVLDWMRDFETSRAVVDEASLLVERAPTPLLRARLTLGMARARFRCEAFGEARTLLERVVAEAEPLGDVGYETLVIALMLLGWVLTFQREHDLAEVVFAKSIALCEQHGDKLHLAAVLNNRYVLRLRQKDRVRAAQDGIRAQRTGREIGQIGVEYATAYNLAELYYFTEDLVAAEPHIRRAVAIELTISKVPLARLLEARMRVFAGDMGHAQPIIDTVNAMQEEAHERGDAGALFDEPHAILLAAVSLASRCAEPDAWQGLGERALATDDHAVRAEVFEIMALHHERKGQRKEALRCLQAALAEAAQASHLIEERVRSQLVRMRS